MYFKLSTSVATAPVMPSAALFNGTKAKTNVNQKGIDKNRILFIILFNRVTTAKVVFKFNPDLRLLKEIVDRARPVAELMGFLIQTEISDTPSFPSGHTVKSMSLALPFVIMALNKDPITKAFKIIVLSFAILVSISRIALQKHYLSDVIAGIAVALFFILVAIFIANRIYKRRNITEMKIAQFTKRFGFIFLGLAVLLCLI